MDPTTAKSTYAVIRGETMTADQFWLSTPDDGYNEHFFMQTQTKEFIYVIQCLNSQGSSIKDVCKDEKGWQFQIQMWEAVKYLGKDVLKLGIFHYSSLLKIADVLYG